jgi:hypothetical protein
VVAEVQQDGQVAELKGVQVVLVVVELKVLVVLQVPVEMEHQVKGIVVVQAVKVVKVLGQAVAAEVQVV